ncbi:MAG: type II secretion system protein [Desulfobacterales bacterium]|jgi:prepilin-type N-terminal cleavage/methylation domain-containing protein
MPLSFISNRLSNIPEEGFTLVELIVTIVLVGIIGTFTTLFMYTGLNSYLRAKDTSEGALKAQIALDRISMELREIEGISAFNVNDYIHYTSRSRTLTGNRKLIYSNGIISLDIDGTANELLDAVSNFSMSLTAANLDNIAGGPGNEEVQAIDVSFNVGEIGRLFSARIFPRNMVTEP